MATSSALAVIAQETGFRGRVEYFMVKAAVAVMSEDSQTPNHTERVLYAKKVLLGTAGVHQFTLAVLTNPTLAALSSALIMDAADNDVEFACNSVFTAFALAEV